MSKGRWRAAAAIAAVLLSTGASAAAAVAPSLSGETLTASAFLGIGVFDVTVDCNPSATSSVQFHAEGAAAGAYPGTFVEDGSSTQEAVGLGRPSFTGGRLLGFDSTFTIFAADGSLVMGEKTLDPATSEALTGFGSEGNCLGDGQQHLADVRAHTFYTATIQRPDGTTWLDSGRSFVNAQSNTQGFVPDTYSFEETYLSDGVVLLPPTSTPGRVSGGGRAGTLSFSVLARSGGDGMDGACNVEDHASDVHVKCLSVDAFVRVAAHVTMRGAAEVDGIPTRYRIDVDDGCTSGAGCDAFVIQLDDGFAGGGALTAGNVKVRD
jgi:hypothetical protein